VMLMWLEIISIIILCLTGTVAFMIVVFGLLSRFRNRLYGHHTDKMLKIRRALGFPHEIGKDGNSPRQDSKLEVWFEDYFEKAYQWIGCFIRKSSTKNDRDYESSQCNNRQPYAITKNFVYDKLPLTWFTFSMSHIRTIVNKLRRAVNESGKEPIYPTIFYSFHFLFSYSSLVARSRFTGCMYSPISGHEHLPGGIALNERV
jgi:hypothetical protein